MIALQSATPARYRLPQADPWRAPATELPSHLKVQLGYSHPLGRGPATQPVTLRNGRLYQGFGLDSCGFEFIVHAPTLQDGADYRHEGLVTSVVYPEVETALSAATDAQRVLVYEHRLHTSEHALLGPAWGDGSAALRSEPAAINQLVRRLLPPGEAAWRLTRRHALVQFWRPLGAPVLHWPLAVCEASSIELSDRVRDPVGPGAWTSSHCCLAPNPRHRWYWLPQQSEHEATLVKLYDSAPAGAEQVGAQAVFRHPAAQGAVALTEHSIELRALLFW